MGNTLAGKAFKDNYKALLQIGNDNAGFAPSTWYAVCVGDGTASGVSVSTAGLKVGTLSGILFAAAGVFGVLTKLSIPLDAPNDEAVAGVELGIYEPASPSIDTITPTSHYIQSPRNIKIRGSGFLSATSVTFGGREVRMKCVVSDTLIECRPYPRATTGAVDVVVTTAAAPNGDAPTATAANGFTFNQTNLAASFTSLFAANNPALYYGGPMELGDDGKNWMAVETVTSGPAGQTWVMTTGGSPAIVQIASQIPSGFGHAQHGVCIAGDGKPWTISHHGMIYRYTSFSSGETYGVDVYHLIDSDDAIPSTVCTGPDGWIVAFGFDGTHLIAWKINPFNPLRQIRRRLSAGINPCSCTIGPSGNMLLLDSATPQIVEIDKNLNVIGSPVPLTPLTGTFGQVDVGCDANVWVTGFAGDQNRVVKCLGTNLATQTYTNVTCYNAIAVRPGPDGYMYVTGANNGTDSLFLAQADSSVFKIATNGTLTATITVTGSAGSGTPKGFAEYLCGGDDGCMYFNVSEDVSNKQGFIGKIPTA